MAKPRIILEGSKRNPIPNSRPVIGPGDRPNPNKHLEVTISLRRKNTVPTWVTHSGVLRKEQMAADYGTTASDFIAIQKFAREHDLMVVEESPLTCTAKLSGSIGNLQKAFGATLRHVNVNGSIFRERTGHLTLPEDVSFIIDGVFGLDNRRQAEPRFRPTAALGVARSFSPVDVAKLYNFPPGNGTGQTIAIIELGGGFTPADLNKYFQGLHLATPAIAAVPVSGGTNLPTGNPNGPDGEVMLDIEVAGAVAPKANIRVYFAPNTDKGFLDAINKAIHDMPTVISISWGEAESAWTKASMNAFEKSFQTAASLSIPVTVASGDDGSTDLPLYNNKEIYNIGLTIRYTDRKIYKCLQNNTKNIAPGNTTFWQLITPSPIAVDFPASAPHALGCGGTHLEGSTSITKEVVWNSNGGATGGGVSSVFPKPGYQNGINIPAAPVAGGGRGVPDVSGDAAPETGYKVRVDGVNTVIGGTSAVAPLWAGLIALLAQKLGHRVPFLNPILYANPNAFRDITVGNNDVGSGGGKYNATPGWDPCTGLGSPKGAAILAILQGPTPTHTSTHTTPGHTTPGHTTPKNTTPKYSTPGHTTPGHTTPPPTTGSSSGSMGGLPASDNWYERPSVYRPVPAQPERSVVPVQAIPGTTSGPSIPSVLSATGGAVSNGGPASLQALVAIVATVATTAITAITAIVANSKNNS